MTVITFGNLSKADGSALVDQNNTIVQATVFGPVDVSQSRINYEEAVVDILFKPKISIQMNNPAFDQIREIENLLKNIFKEVILTRLHPRTCISIYIQEIYDGGSLLSASINAACCALIDAGVPMRCPVSSTSLTMGHEENICKFDFVFDNNYDLITILTRGGTSETNLRKAIELGKEEAKKNFDTIRDGVRDRFA